MGFLAWVGDFFVLLGQGVLFLLVAGALLVMRGLLLIGEAEKKSKR